MAELTQLRRGDTPTWRVAVKEADNITPFDLTGYTVRCTAKTNLSDADSAAVFTLVSPTNITIVSPATAGLIDIVPPHTATNTLTTDLTVWLDVQLARSSPLRVYTVILKQISIVRDVTETAP
jgi:hypothetical protein